jgi:hypothetical protein
MPLTYWSRISMTMWHGGFRLTCLAWLLLLVVFVPVGARAYAQTVQVKVADGRNGKPVIGACVNVWVGSERKDAMAIPTNESGIARLRLTGKEDDVNISRKWKGCGLFGVIDPVVRYQDSIKVNVGYVLCQPHKSDHSWLTISEFSTDRIVQDGIVTANSCGSAAALPTPGEIVIFVRPLNWWEKLSQ